MSELPKGWVRTSLADISGGISYGFTTKSSTKGSSARLLRITDIQDYSVDWNSLPFCDDQPDVSFLVQSGDIVVARTGATTGKSFLIKDVPAPTAFASYLIRIAGSPRIQSEYVWKFMQGPDYWRQIQVVSKGTAQPGANAVILGQVGIPLPPLAEQKRIVAKLDALNAKSARARTELARIETLVSRYKQTVLSKAFSGELTREWPAVSLDLVSEVIFDGPFGSNLKSVDYTSEGPRVIRLENIGARVFMEDKRTHISEEKFSSLARHLLQANDLLFSSFVSEEVRACLFPEDVAFKAINKADCFCIRLNAAKILPKFALFQLTSELTYRHFAGRVHGATRPRINLSQLKKYEIFTPSISVQQEIVRHIESAFAIIDRLAIQAKRALELVGKLDEAILAKAFRGELVPQDENDEPAEQLLERIRAERAAAPKVKRGRGGAVS